MNKQAHVVPVALFPEQDIDWIDSFVRGIRDYVYVRERDNLLILLPNQAYKLNRTGVVLLKRTLEGEKITDILRSKSDDLPGDTGALGEVHDFFCDVRALVMGCLGDGTGRRSVEEVPYKRPHSEWPVLSEIALTYRCNLSCRFCYAGCRCSSRPTEREMSTVEVRDILSIIRYDAEVPSVSWTGGEPLLREDLVDLTRYASQIGLRVNLITNGTLLEAGIVSRLKDAGLKSAQVSLEGPDADVHDGLTQVPGSFDRTLNGIRLLKNAGLHVHTNTTVNRLNAPHLPELVRLVKDLGMDRFSMNMVIPCGSASADVSISYTEMAGLMQTIQRAARDEDVQFLWYSPTPYCIFNPVAARLGGKSCAACEGLLSVGPNGDVYPCSSLPESVGNLLRRPFDKVWKGRSARYWRHKRYACRTCRKCEWFDVCTGACPIYWRANGYAELHTTPSSKLCAGLLPPHGPDASHTTLSSSAGSRGGES
jgi:radical SAM protein with 4Fe4S-binding SPASM domain